MGKRVRWGRSFRWFNESAECWGSPRSTFSLSNSAHLSHPNLSFVSIHPTRRFRPILLLSTSTQEDFTSYLFLRLNLASLSSNQERKSIKFTRALTTSVVA